MDMCAQMAESVRDSRVVLEDLPGHLLEGIMGLVPLPDLVGARSVCRVMQNATDNVCKERGLRAAAFDRKKRFDSRSCCEKICNVGAALWQCGSAKASWLHHIACVGSPYQVALALQLGEAVDGMTERQSFELSPLMLACALGRKAVAEVLLEVSLAGTGAGVLASVWIGGAHDQNGRGLLWYCLKLSIACSEAGTARSCLDVT